MKKIFSILLAALAVMAVSCGDNTYIGSSVNDGSTVTIIADSSFCLVGESVEYPVVQGRTASQLLGCINASNFGEITSEVVMQMVPSNKITSVTADQIDHVKLCMFIVANSGFIGDSVVPMRANVYKLHTPLSAPIFSDFDITNDYDEKGFLGSAPYSASDVEKLDSIKASHFHISYIDEYYGTTTTTELRELSVNLDKVFAVELIKEYEKDPAKFANVRKFTDYFPGLYIANSFGKGRMMNFYAAEVEMRYHTTVESSTGADSTVWRTESLLAAGPEVITNNLITLKTAPQVKQWVAEGKAVLQAPVGYNVHFRMPAQDIIDKYKLSKKSINVVNTCQVTIPVKKVANDYNLAPPANVLVIKTSRKDEFFEKKELPNNLDSFLATYDSESKQYVVAGMRYYLIDIINNQNGIASEDDMDFTIIPVDVTQMEQSASGSYTYDATASLVTVKVAPMVSKPAIAILDLDKARVQFCYSRLGDN